MQFSTIACKSLLNPFSLATMCSQISNSPLWLIQLNEIEFLQRIKSSDTPTERKKFLLKNQLVLKFEKKFFDG